MPPPDNSAFKQQNLRAWRPILTPRLVILLFSVGGIIFIPIGAVILAYSNEVVEVVGGDYSDACCIANCSSRVPHERVDRNPCDVQINVPKRMEPPVYMYYKLTDYYQNHRRYVRSRDDKQLKGVSVPAETLRETSSCRYHVLADPAGGNGDNNIISPCGLVAASVFNDSFKLFATTQSPPDASTQVPLEERGIAWPSDLEIKFKNNANGSTGQNFAPFSYERSQPCSALTSQTARTACEATPGAGWCYPGSGFCTEDEHFVVWMRAAGLPNFRKLFARINTTLEPGTYTVRITNGVLQTNNTYKNFYTGQTQNFLYPVSSFGGTKAIVLSTTTWLGGANFFLGYAYVIVGVVCIVLALCFLLKYRFSPRDLGDASYITWHKDSAAPM